MNAFRKTPHDSKALSAGTDARAIIAENPFLSETVLDVWVRVGVVVRAGGSITTPDGGRYLLRDAIRILGRRDGDADPYGLTGRVECLRDLLRQGATISSDAVRFGPGVYDAELGFLAVLLPSPDQSGPNAAVR
jgi:hypothetical protein